MDAALHAQAKAAERVGVGIAAEQQRLVDDHRRVPDRRRAAESGQGHARDHRLDQEEQERAGEDGEDEPRPTVAHADHAPSSRAAWGA